MSTLPFDKIMLVGLSNFNVLSAELHSFPAHLGEGFTLQAHLKRFSSLLVSNGICSQQTRQKYQHNYTKLQFQGCGLAGIELWSFGVKSLKFDRPWELFLLPARVDAIEDKTMHAIWTNISTSQVTALWDK